MWPLSLRAAVPRALAKVAACGQYVSVSPVASIVNRSTACRPEEDDQEVRMAGQGDGDGHDERYNSHEAHDNVDKQTLDYDLGTINSPKNVRGLNGEDDNETTTGSGADDSPTRSRTPRSVEEKREGTDLRIGEPRRRSSTPPSPPSKSQLFAPWQWDNSRSR